MSNMAKIKAPASHKQGLKEIALHKKKQEKKWYTIRSLLGNKWAHFFVLLGARDLGKSFSVQDYGLNQALNRDVPLYWIRLNEASTKNMLQNNGAKMWEPLLAEKYHLNTKVSGDTVYTLLPNPENPEKPIKKKVCSVYALSTAHNLKGAALYNAKTFKGCNIIIDEFQLEKSQRKTFDILYQVKMLIENICRENRDKVRVFFIANNTEECSELLSKGFGFIPLQWGLFKLKSSSCVIDNIPNSEAYNKRRQTALVNILEKRQETSNFTNKVIRDMKLINKKRCIKPSYIIKFSKQPSDWFTVWDSNTIKPYNKEKLNSIPMKRYIDDRGVFQPDLVAMIFEQHDANAFMYCSLITQTRFRSYLQEIKKQ